MAKEVLDIVDTAVKVGLGAIISGGATYYVTRLKQSAETTRDYRQHKWQILEGALDDATGYMLELGTLFATLDGLRRDNPEALRIDATRESAFLEERGEALQDAVLKRNRAVSRLKLVGEAKAADNLAVLSDLEDRIRAMVILKGCLPQTAELNSWFHQITKAKDAFVRSLAENYRAER